MSRYHVEDDGLNLLLIRDDGVSRIMVSRPRSDWAEEWEALRPFMEPVPAVVESESLIDS